MPLYFVLGALAVGLAALVINHDAGRTFGMVNDEFAQLVYLGTIGAVLMATMLAGRQRMADLVRHGLIWTVIILALATGYLYRFDLQEVGHRLSAGLVPGRAVTRPIEGGGDEVVIRKAMNGHFQVRAMVNGGEVDFLVDTGATSIALGFEDAMAIGIDPDALQFTQPVMTANGMAQAAPVRIDRIAIGGIERSNVRATVSEPGRLERSLLGMSFLGNLSSFEMRGDELILRD
jgi:aspartyl protease family protein